MDGFLIFSDVMLEQLLFAMFFALLVHVETLW